MALGWPLLLALLGGCYIEPEPKPWMGDQTLGLACHLEEGGAAIEVTADLPIYCASLAANIHDAASQLGIPPQALSGLTVHIQDADCLVGIGSDDGSPCTYARATGDGGDASDWAPAHIELNRRGTQVAHELWHLRGYWENAGNSNTQHHSPWWTDSVWAEVDGLAEGATALH